MRLRKIGSDLLPYALLRVGKAERQACQQAFGQCAGTMEHWGAACLARGMGAAQRQLLRQQFVKADALPGGLRASLDAIDFTDRRRMVQRAHAAGEFSELQRCAQRVRQRVAQISPRQRHGDQLPQRTLADAGSGRIDRCQRLGQRFAVAYHAKARMNQFGAEKAAAHFAEYAQARAGLQYFLLARIEIEKAQDQFTALVQNPTYQLPARAERNFAGHHRHLELRGNVWWCVTCCGDSGLILIAQRQMQDQIVVGAQPELFQLARQHRGDAGYSARFFSVSRQRGWRPPRPARRAAIP